MHDTTQRCCGTQESIGAGRDTGAVWLASIEEGRVGEAFVDVLDKDTDHASKGCTDGHGWDKNTCRDFATKGYDDKKCSDDCRNSQTAYHVPSLITVAELVVTMSVSTLLEQNLHTLRHVDPEEHIGIADNRGKHRQRDCFSDGIVPEKLLPKDLHFEVPFDNKSAVKPTKDSNDDIEQNLKEVPAAIVFDLKHDELTGSKGIHCLLLYQYNDLLEDARVYSQPAQPSLPMRKSNSSKVS
jgi:hypothetical protein